jgi:FkbM family methyltransferase
MNAQRAIVSPRPSLLAQPILACVLSDHRLARTIARQARRLIVRHGDPLVEIRVAGARPLSHDLPLYRRSFMHYDTALPRLARYLQTARGAMLAVVDVGANIGDSAAALLALPETRVLAIEGNERFFQLRTANSAQWADRLTPVHCLLGERSEWLAAAIDAGRGTGRLRPSEDTAVLRSLADVVDEYPAFRNAGLVKIDTDGFDIAILRGARPWLAAVRPVLFFEYDPHFWRPITPDGARLFCELAHLGYGPLLAYDNFGWLVWSGSVRDERRLEELDASLSGRESGVYVDLCAFPATDAGLFEHFRASEVRHFTGASTTRVCAESPSPVAWGCVVPDVPRRRPPSRKPRLHNRPALWWQT